jgi:hypothetical protein
MNPMPKLTLRDLFAVVTIVALALGWWVDRSRFVERLERLEAASRPSTIPPGQEKRHSGFTFTLDVF